MEAWAGSQRRVSPEQALVEDQSDSITEAGHWAGKSPEAAAGRWVWVAISIPAEANDWEGLGESEPGFCFQVLRSP